MSSKPFPFYDFRFDAEARTMYIREQNRKTWKASPHSWVITEQLKQYDASELAPEEWGRVLQYTCNTWLLYSLQHIRMSGSYVITNKALDRAFKLSVGHSQHHTHHYNAFFDVLSLAIDMLMMADQSENATLQDEVRRLCLIRLHSMAYQALNAGGVDFNVLDYCAEK